MWKIYSLTITYIILAYQRHFSCSTRMLEGENYDVDGTHTLRSSEQYVNSRSISLAQLPPPAPSPTPPPRFLSHLSILVPLTNHIYFLADPSP